MSRDPRRDPTDPPPKRVLGAPIRQSMPEIPQAPEPEPTAPAKASMVKEYGALVAAVFAGLTGLASVLKPPPESATAKETQEWRVEAQRLRDEIAAANIPDLNRKLDAWQKKQNQESALNGVQSRQIYLLADAFSTLNGGPPSRSWPEPDGRDWVSSNSPPPIHKTDRQWPELPDEK